MTWWSIILNGVLGIVTIVVSVLLRRQTRERIEAEKRLHRDKRGCYLAFAEKFNELSSGGNTRGLGKFMRKWVFILMMRASDDVFRAFLKVREQGPKFEKEDYKEPKKQRELLKSTMGNLLLKMREDLFEEGTQLEEEELLASFVDDYLEQEEN